MTMPAEMQNFSSFPFPKKPEKNKANWDAFLQQQ
jgi:hypothetical protein